MKIHWHVWYMAIKDVLAATCLFYFFGQTAALWWITVSAWFYSLIALNGVIGLELSAPSKREEPHFDF